MIALRKLGIERNSIKTIFVSHLHGDHVGGLPFFILDAQFYSRRRETLSLVGPPGFEKGLLEAMEIFFRGSSTAQRNFEIEIHEVAPSGLPTSNGIRLSTIEMKHACGAPPLGLRLTCEGKTIAYSGDTEWTDAFISLERYTDLCIVEALICERRISQHLDYASLLSNVDHIGAKRIILTHLGPDMLARMGYALHEVAEDGKIIDF